MNCPVCGAPLEDGAKFCTECGAKLAESVPAEKPAPAPAPAPVPAGEEPEVPKEYKPIKPWGYVGLELLFSIPVIGLIALLIFTFGAKNVNRRNFACAYWCALLVVLGLLILGVILALVTGTAQDVVDAIEQVVYSF